jgi:hypothetical protein
MVGWVDSRDSVCVLGNREIFCPRRKLADFYMKYVNIILHLPLVCTISNYSASDFMHVFSAMLEYIAENISPNVVSIILLHHSSMSSYILKICNFGNMEIYTFSNKSNKV